MIPREPLDSRRVRLLLVGLAVLVIGGATGLLRGCSGVSVDKEEAVEIARAHIELDPDFDLEPDVRLLRQGFLGSPDWVVVFRVPDPDDPEQYQRQTSVMVDGRTGAVNSVVDETSPPEDDDG